MKKKEFVDDGRTIVSMDFDRIPYKTSLRRNSIRSDRDREQSLERNETRPSLNLTKKEQRAITFGAIQALLPIIVYFVVAYFLVFLLLDLFWVN